MDDIKERRVIILNGPPNVGKDTLAVIMQRILGKSTKLASMKDPMFKIGMALTGMTEVEWFNRYNDRNMKEVPQEYLAGLSFREFMIHISEKMVKPLFGPHHFGVLASRAVSDTGTTLFTDGGFNEELEVIASRNPRHKINVVRLYRDGCSFEGDSREYLSYQGENIYYYNQLLTTGMATDDAFTIVRRIEYP
jgi:hypothetical protein